MLEDIPIYTKDLIRVLKEIYPDTFIVEEEEVNTPQYWKKAGIIELIRLLDTNIQYVKERNTRT